MARTRGWSFTVHDISQLSKCSLECLECDYLIVGAETAPTTGKKHWQCYVHFHQSQRFAWVKKVLPEGSHIEAAKGTALQNKKYCSKDTILIERGALPRQGKRTDLVIVRECLEDGGNMRDVVATACSIQGMKAGEKILQYTEHARNWKPEVLWFWGPTGSGKTRLAAESMPDAWWSGKNLRWWQSYDAHEEVIIDDFRGDFCTFHELLRILDRYPYIVETKGGSRQLLAKKIIITCPTRPERCYPGCGENMSQLMRRITEIREFAPPGKSDTEVSDTEVGGNTRAPTLSLEKTMRELAL